MTENNLLNKNPEVVGAMFDGIAHRYDFLNHFLSFGIDKIWRKRLIKRIMIGSPKIVLDIATGTADLAIQLANTDKQVTVTGIDISAKMLEIGQQKLHKLNLSDRINLIHADSLNIPLPNNTFDAAMVAFGVRNFDNPVKGMDEIYRVLKPGASFFVLEFSMPKSKIMLILYKFYFKYVLPIIGRIVSGHKLAYTYLPDSVTKFPDGEDFISLMNQSGFSDCKHAPLSFGIATIYSGVKPHGNFA